MLKSLIVTKAFKLGINNINNNTICPHKGYIARKPFHLIYGVVSEIDQYLILSTLTDTLQILLLRY